jgi:hypothetical protein
VLHEKGILVWMDIGFLFGFDDLGGRAAGKE